MPWLIVILVLLNFFWIIPVVWIKNPATIGAKIGGSAIFLVLALIFAILIYLLCISVAMKNPDNISFPFSDTTEHIKTNNVIVGDDKVYYYNENSCHYETVLSPWFTIRNSQTNHNLVSIYKFAEWKSPIREFLYGNSILSDYYVIYLTGD